MFLIRKEIIERLKNNYGESAMLSGYVTAQGMSSITNEAVLLVSENKLIILFISKFSSRLVQKIEFDKVEISNSIIKTGLLETVWTFTGRKQKWKFRIQRKILPLGNLQTIFLNFVYKIYG